MKLSVPLITKGDDPPLFIVPSAATTSLSLTLLARSITPSRPIYSFVFPELEDKQVMPQNVEEMGARFVSELKSIRPKGPYFLAGHCFGATPAVEIVRQLEAAGDTVALLVLIESFAVGIAETPGTGSPTDETNEVHAVEFEAAIHEQISQMGAKLGMLPVEVREHFVNVTTHHVEMAFSYLAKPISAPILQVRTTQHPESIFRNWRNLTTRGYIERIIPGTTDSILQAPDVTALASEIGDVLERFS